MKISDGLLKEAASMGRAKWLRKYLVENLGSLESGDADYQRWFDSLITLMESRELREPTQQKDYLSDVRNSIKVLDPNHPALAVIDFDKATWIQINNQNSDRIAQRATKFIDDPDAIVKRATTLLNSYVWSEIAAGLAVLTGRRCTEIIKTAEFTYKTNYSVVFSGSLKRKQEAIECIFEIPTLCEAQLVIKAIKSLREKLGKEIKVLSKRQINSRFSSAVAKQCDRYFSELVPPRDDKDNLYTHLFRAIYGTIASFWYCPAIVPEMEFRAAIQGHYQILDEENPTLRRSLAANRNYFDYKISDGKGNVDGRLGIKLNLPSVKVIEQFANYHAHSSGYQQQSLAIPVDPDSLNKHQDSIRNLSHELLAVDIPKVKPNSLAEDKARSNDLGRPKYSNRQITSIMNQTTKTHKDLVIPAFLHSRLEAIASQLEVSSDKTIEELFKWTEIGLALVRELNLDEPDPNMVFHSVQAFKQQSTNSGSQQHNDLSRGDFAELASAKQQIASLTKSLDRLTEIWHSSPTNTVRESEKKQRRRAGEASSASKANAIDHVSNDLHQQDLPPKKPEDSKRQEKRINSIKIIRRDSSETVIEDINHAIDAVMAFNDAEERSYNQKFYIGIGSVKELSNRGDAAIRRVLKEREEEIQNHLAAHELDKNHNLSRRDEAGNEYPNIDVEPEIDYEKITKVNSD